MNQFLHSAFVQPAVIADRRICQNINLDARVQLGQSWLNARLTCARMRLGHLWIVPAPINSRGGDYFQLNRETASCHRFAGTWRAFLREVLALAVRRCSPSHTPRNGSLDTPSEQEMENVRALHGACGFKFVVKPLASRAALRIPSAHHSEPCGFLFLSHFRSDNSYMRRLGIAPALSWGDSLVFCSLLSLLHLPVRN
jgi:hypothetical protein